VVYVSVVLFSVNRCFHHFHRETSLHKVLGLLVFSSWESELAQTYLNIFCPESSYMPCSIAFLTRSYINISRILLRRQINTTGNIVPNATV
jgi:uncharacterized membrane protein